VPGRFSCLTVALNSKVMFILWKVPGMLSCLVLKGDTHMYDNAARAQGI
jgi:hypothetical protein